MSPQNAKPCASNSARCSHRFANGKRCRLFASGLDSPFCPSHASLPENQLESPETAAILTAGLTDFESPSSVNAFLGRLLLLLARQKISVRRAASLAYIASQLIRTFAPMDREANGEPQIIFDVPGPDTPLTPDTPTDPPTSIDAAR